MLKRFTDRLRVSTFALALMAGVFILPASPLQAQITLPPVTVGAGMQTSYVHTDPDTGNTLGPVSSEQRPTLRERARHRKNQVHVQYGIRRRHQQDRRIGCSGSSGVFAQVQHLGRPFASSERSRQPLRTVLRASLGHVYQMASRTDIPSFPRAVITASSIGATSARSESLGRRVRWRFGDRQA